MSAMPTLAIAMIVKNEADNLVACLRSCEGLADELIVMDGGSTDNTVDIAKGFGAKVVTQTNWQGFGQQRRLAQKYATADWMFWLDADEQLTPELKIAIRATIDQSAQNIIYSVSRRSWVFGKFVRFGGWYPDRVARLYHRELTQYTDAFVHERVGIPSGTSVKPLKGDLLHYTYRDLEHYLVKSAQYARLWADQRQAAGKRTSLLQGVLHGTWCFLRMYVFKAGFLDGRSGFLLALLSAHSTFVKYADLWTRYRPRPKS